MQELNSHGPAKGLGCKTDKNKSSVHKLLFLPSETIFYWVFFFCFLQENHLFQGTLASQFYLKVRNNFGGRDDIWQVWKYSLETVVTHCWSCVLVLDCCLFCGFVVFGCLGFFKALHPHFLFSQRKFSILHSLLCSHSGRRTSMYLFRISELSGKQQNIPY